MSLASDGEQSVCIKVKDEIFDILDVVHSCNHAQAAANQKSSAAGTHTSHNSMRDASYRERYLSHYKCNVVALMILEEAMLIFQEEVGGDASNLNTIDTLLLASLEFLIDEFKKTPPYRSKVDIEMVDEKIRLFQLKFKGHGIDYLMEARKRKNSYLYS